MSVKVAQPRFAVLTKPTKDLLSVLSVRQLEVSQIPSPYKASERGRSVALTNSPRRTSPLERLKKLGSEASTHSEISETPVRVTDKADKSHSGNSVTGLHAPRPRSYDPNLLAAGWHPQERCGKTIWRHPVTGFCYSEEMARCVSRGEKV